MAVLVVIMWFGGYVSGYSTNFQEFNSMQTCEDAKAAWLQMAKSRASREGYFAARCVAR